MASPTPRDRSSSPELGSPSKTTQYHKKTGRPIRKSAGKVKAVVGYVDSKIIEEDDENPIEMPSEDEDGRPIKQQRKRKRTPSPSPPPLDPIIRDEEPGDLSDDESGYFHNSSEINPIMLQFNVPLGFHGPLIVKLDRSLLVQDDVEVAAHDMQPPRTKRKVAARKQEFKEQAAQAKYRGFTDLPPELRNKVYRHLFVTGETFNFSSPAYFRRSSQFLRTCRTVHSEGCSILYGENTFAFDRNKHTRGPFWELTPKEIGYTDVRRFLNMIGPENLAYLRDIKLVLEDASPSATPYLGHEERRYINDEHLIDCLRILRGAKLRKFTLTFQGRRALLRTDIKFLGYLEQVKADEIHDKASSPWYYHAKIGPFVWNDLKAAMVRKKKLYAREQDGLSGR